MCLLVSLIQNFLLVRNVFILFGFLPGELKIYNNLNGEYKQ